MMELKQIENNEKGLSVRAKINNLFREIIEGKEGINEIQNSLRGISKELQEISDLDAETYEELKEQILKSYDYTDASVADLIIYINTMEGGLSGFAEDLSYNPDFPPNKAVTVIALKVGTYPNFLDSSGNPIAISDVGITIFYRGANSIYWKYSTLPITVNAEREFTEALINFETLGELLWNDYAPIVRDGKSYKGTIAAFPKAFRDNTMPGSVIEEETIKLEKLHKEVIDYMHKVISHDEYENLKNSGEIVSNQVYMIYEE